MTFEAPFHLKRAVLPHQRHLVHPAVAGNAANSFIHMNAMIEIDEIRKVVDSRPAQRPTGAKTFTHRVEHWTVRPYLRVAVHANVRGWNAGKRADFHLRMTVAAIDADAIDVMLVTERDGLDASHPYLGGI
jgi:hypothetical protein